MGYDEKKVDQEKSASTVESFEGDNVLEEPDPEQSLHRGLKARQISMIAVCVFIATYFVL